jgi:uncharacterized protein (DUF4213/DUF364 family)
MDIFMNHDASSDAVSNASDWIFDEAVQCLGQFYGTAMPALRIDRLVVGVFATGVKLSNGCGGVAFTSPEIVREAGTRILGSAGTAIHGMAAEDAVLGLGLGPFGRIIRLAVLNALSVPVLDARTRETAHDDLSALGPLFAGRRVCMVGAIVPLLKRLRELRPAEVLVADRKPETLTEADGCTAIPLDRLPEALASCQTAILTGATIPNGSLSELLGYIAPEAAIAVVGPSAGFIPDPLFRRGVALIGTTLVVDADKTLDILAEGGGMYHLFDGCVRKINMANHNRMRQLGFACA